MRIIQRLIFYVYTLLLTLLSLGVVLMCLSLISPDLMWTTISDIEGNLKIGLAGTILFLGGLWVLLAGFFRKERTKSITHYNKLGNVDISLTAIESLIEKLTKTIGGVRDVKVDVSLTNPKDGMGITAIVKTVVSQDVDIPEVTAEMQNYIQEHIKTIVGIELDEIKIVIETISNDFKAKSRVQ